MPSMPLPFVVAIVLTILLVVLLRGTDSVRTNAAFLFLIAACVLQSALLGLRWGYGIEAVRFILPITAAAGPPLVYASFAGLGRLSRRPWLHALPVILVATLVLLWPETIDIALVAIFLIYALALSLLARLGPDALDQATIEGAAPTHRALQLAAATLAASALVDILVAFDIQRLQGRHAALIVAIANLCGLVAIGFAGLVGGNSRPPRQMPGIESAAPEEPGAGVAEDGAVVDAIEALMVGSRLYRDPELSLDRLARKAGVPARRISAAINRAKGRNVSQYVNEHRVAEACRLLSTTARSVTEIMFEAGFQTKSNFNREFRRVTGKSPVAWRVQNAGENADDTPTISEAATARS